MNPEDRDRLNRLTERVIGCAYTVANKLVPGYLEKVYENAMVIELRKAGLEVQQQYPVSILYDGIVVGEYLADLLVEKTVVVELKAGKGIDEAHVAQCINYLVSTGKPICLLIHFGERVKVKRIIRPGLKLDP